jgi:hypothetical protein
MKILRILMMVIVIVLTLLMVQAGHNPLHNVQVQQQTQGVTSAEDSALVANLFFSVLEWGMDGSLDCAIAANPPYPVIFSVSSLVSIITSASDVPLDNTPPQTTIPNFVLSPGNNILRASYPSNGNVIYRLDSNTFTCPAGTFPDVNANWLCLSGGPSVVHMSGWRLLEFSTPVTLDVVRLTLTGVASCGVDGDDACVGNTETHLLVPSDSVWSRLGGVFTEGNDAGVSNLIAVNQMVSSLLVARGGNGVGQPDVRVDRVENCNINGNNCVELWPSFSGSPGACSSSNLGVCEIGQCQAAGGIWNGICVSPGSLANGQACNLINEVCRSGICDPETQLCVEPIRPSVTVRDIIQVLDNLLGESASADGGCNTLEEALLFIDAVKNNRPAPECN